MVDDLEWAKLLAPVDDPNKEALWSDWDGRNEKMLQTNKAGTVEFGGDVELDWQKLGLRSHKAVVAAELAAVQKAAEIAAEVAGRLRVVRWLIRRESLRKTSCPGLS